MRIFRIGLARSNLRFHGNMRRPSSLVRRAIQTRARHLAKAILGAHIRDDRDFANHVDYIHINPVKHGYAKRAVDWLHSTIHRFIERGVIDENWATTAGDGEYGEG